MSVGGYFVVASFLASKVWAFQGLTIFQGNVFRCWDNLQQTAIHSELGASAAIFLAGYSIDCLMLRYQVCLAPSKSFRSILVCRKTLSDKLHPGLHTKRAGESISFGLLGQEKRSYGAVGGGCSSSHYNQIKSDREKALLDCSFLSNRVA